MCDGWAAGRTHVGLGDFQPHDVVVAQQPQNNDPVAQFAHLLREGSQPPAPPRGGCVGRGGGGVGAGSAACACGHDAACVWLRGGVRDARRGGGGWVGGAGSGGGVEGKRVGVGVGGGRGGGAGEARAYEGLEVGQRLLDLLEDALQLNAHTEREQSQREWDQNGSGAVTWKGSGT